MVWIIGILAIFTLAIFFMVFTPFINQDLGDRVVNLTHDFDQSSSNRVEQVVNNIRIFFPIALIVIVVGVLLYMAASMQKEEPHADII